jgi:hypothetical protein
MISLAGFPDSKVKATGGARAIRKRNLCLLTSIAASDPVLISYGHAGKIAVFPVF